MAKLTYIYRTEDKNYVNVNRRQLPVVAGDNLMMLMDLNSKGLCIDSPQIRGKELEEFTRKFNLLDADELRQSLEIDSTEFLAVLNQCVQCVGCRRRVERLFYQLTHSNHLTLDPLIFTKSSTLSVNEDKLKTPQALGTILYRHHDVLNNLMENKLRNKTRCVLHSLDTFRSKPFSETWREVWSSMKISCREELVVIETKELHETLESYLKKHKFCQGCRTKIEKAYKILVGETSTKEKGYVANLYANIKKCHPDKHIHVTAQKIDFMDSLIRRAEPEVSGSFSKQRERHAKTLEIAQEEVLTCVGMIMYERLRRIYVALREEERACQVLAAVGVHALCRSFDTCVEKKQGISNLELLYQEISRAEKAKEHKREQKKLKKKKKKIEKKNNNNNCRACESDEQNSEQADEEEQEDEAVYVEGEEEEDEYLDEEEVEEEEEEIMDLEILHDKSVIHYGETTAGRGGGGGGVGVLTELNIGAFVEEDGSHDSSEWLSVGQAQRKKKSQKQKKQKQQAPRAQKSKMLLKSNKVEKAVTKPITTADHGEVHNATSCSMAEKCDDCLEPTGSCPCDVKDSGYGSEPHSQRNSRTSSAVSTPDGSVISCSDGFCNHDHGHDLDEDTEHSPHFQHATCSSLAHLWQKPINNMSLKQMLDEYDCEEEEDEHCNIPQKLVAKYENHWEKVQQKRQELRKTLKENFMRLCLQRGYSPSFDYE